MIPSRLRRLGRVAQLEHMEVWFRDHYLPALIGAPDTDLAFVAVGPTQHAYVVLAKEFGDLVAEGRIDELVKKLEQECAQWTPRKQPAVEANDVSASVGDTTADQTQVVSVPFFGTVGDHPGSVVSPSVGDRVARRPRTLEQNQSSIWPEEQDAPAATATGSSPIVPPGDRETAGASPPDPSATFGGAGAFHGDTTVVSPPESDAGIPAASAEQRPAAFRFHLRDGKIDVLPEPPEPVDQSLHSTPIMSWSPRYGSCTIAWWGQIRLFACAAASSSC